MSCVCDAESVTSTNTTNVGMDAFSGGGVIEGKARLMELNGMEEENGF